MKCSPLLQPGPLFFLIIALSPFEAPAFQSPAYALLADFDRRQEKAAPAAMADKFAKAAELRNRVPGLKVDFDPVRGSPKYIASTTGFLSGPAAQGRGISPLSLRALPANDPHRAIKAFLNEHSGLFGHGAEVLATATLKRDFVTPHNGLRTVIHEQQLDQIPVYEALLMGHITQRGELVNLSSQFLPNLEEAATVGTPRISCHSGRR